MLKIILIIIILYIIIKKDTEYFDQRVDGTTREQCGIICTKTLGCSGFAYDENNNFCYLSKDNIVLRPEKKNYTNFYNKKFPRCNKLYMIDDPYYNSRNNVLRNATYQCMNEENDIDNKENIMYDMKERKNIDIKNINKESVNKYTFVEIDWVNTGPINLDNNLHLITNPTESNSVYIMKEYDEEFSGDYLYDHCCVRNISKEDCMKQCLDDKNCVGTEWNPVFMNKVGEPNKYTLIKNVCCPKRTINKVVPRRENMKLGHFYLKDVTNKNDIKKNNVLVDYENTNKNINKNEETGNYAKWNKYDF